MDIKSWAVALGALGTFVTTIWAVIHGYHSDLRQADHDHQEIQEYIVKQIKEDNHGLRKELDDVRKQFDDDLNELKAKKDAMEQELNQQIALKVSENEALRKRNAALERENQAYRERYGEL
ncbi:hypothetical protein [Levilactobacillus brevis]|uniref:hypothetical protein n=1 Tax=Levilactobacillus brevis TaxID=1580 RepID=UPI000BEA67D4|nr:hypothetical protein [Levilactobacillus brevis]STX20366.1 Uncharacterised protein [Levilactobacillus brevis]